MSTSPTANPPTAAGPPARDERSIALLRRLVEIRSLSGHEHEAAEFLVTEMERLGLSSSIDDAGNAVGATRSPGGDIVLLGHMDTVPGEIPVRVEGNVLHGRGAVDAKGPLAAFIMAAATARLPRGIGVTVIGAVEEESATSKGARFAASTHRPRACIIGEPSAWDGVTLGYKGRLLARYELEGSCGHSAGPNESAADCALAWWQGVRRSIEERNRGIAGPFKQIQAGLRSINTESDGLHERAHATAGFRLPPGSDHAWLEELCRRGAGGATVTFSGHEHAYVGDRHSPLVRAFTSAIRDAGASPRVLVKTGTSDMNVVGPAWNCPIVAYGPGDSALDHTPEERIDLDEYLRSITVLRAVLERLGAELAEAQGNHP